MIEIDNLTYSYDTKVIFKNLSLNLSEGNIYGLLGKNGAGKTTLLKLICGLLRTKNGSCRTLGFESYKKNPDMLKEIFFIPETYFLPDNTVEEYVKLISPFYGKFDEKFFYEKIKKSEINRAQELKSLSYGQKKKFLLIFGLATKCEILLFDEPTNGLDIPAQRQIRKLLVECMFDKRMVIISTHHVREMENIFDSMIVIENGKIVFNKKIEEINQKLSVKVVSDLNDAGNILYSEEIPGGYSILSKNPEGMESKIDMEFLFNAVINQNERINGVFVE